MRQACGFRSAAAVLAAAAAFAGGARAQSTASAPTNATGSLWQALDLTKNSELSFGNIVKPAVGNGSATITIATDGSRSIVGQGALISSGPNSAPGAATYTVSGEGGQSFAVSLSPSSVTMNRSGGGSITATLNPSYTTNTLGGVLGASGSRPLSIGGSITISDSTLTGAYSGTFTVTVTYN